MPVTRRPLSGPGPSGLFTALVLLLSSAAHAFTPTPEQVRAVADDLLVDQSVEVHRLDVPRRLFADPRPFELDVEIAGVVRTLSLVPHSVRSPDFRLLVQTDAGIAEVTPVPRTTTYRGFVRDTPGSRVTASVIEGRLHASIDLATGSPMWRVQPVDHADPSLPDDAHAIYNDADVIAPAGRCGNDHSDDSPAETQASISLRSGTGCFAIAQIALDADYEYYLLNGQSVSNTLADMEMILNDASSTFESELGITHTVSVALVRTTDNDGYGATDSSALLNQVRDVWTPLSNVYEHDLVQLFTGKVLDGNIIGRAFIGTVCNPTDDVSLVRSRWTPSLSLRAILTAHELGHNWSSPHDNEQGSACGATPFGFIMNPAITGGLTQSFSQCSRAFINAERDAAGCLSGDDPAVGNAANDSVTADDDTPTLIDVLGNDDPGCGAELVLPSVTSSNGGTLDIIPANGPERDQIRYTPPPVLPTGSDAFTYQISNAFGTASADVSIDIESTIQPVTLESPEPGIEARIWNLPDLSQGRYEAIPDFGTLGPPDLVLIEPQINVPSAISPFLDPSVDVDFADYFQGYLLIDTTDEYAFQIQSNDGSRVFIGGVLVIENDGWKGFFSTASGNITLQQGYHLIRVEHFNDGLASGLILSYESDAVPFQIVPETKFFIEGSPDACPGDINNDGQTSVGDILDYLALWSADDPDADTNMDGLFSVGDILDYLALWADGC